MSLHDGLNAVSLDRDLLDPGMASLSDFFSPNGAGAAIMGASDTRHYPQSILENLLQMVTTPLGWKTLPAFTSTCASGRKWL